MIVDDITIRIKSGKGGDGIIAFNKNKLTLGPSGGTGGNGGNVYFQGISDIGGLNRLRNQKVFEAENGKNGRHQLNDGTNGKDITIQVPIGTVIHNLTTTTDSEIIRVGEQIMGAKGGHGGRGNFHFRGPRDTSPKRFEYGRPGQEFEIRLELKMIADIGIIGLPNAGKSSLLNALTRASSKVANYQFTTLEPYLGAYYDIIMADIPGLIEGASQGKGLGVKFLRHIERTQVLFHLISYESENPVKDYKSIRKELGAYNKLLLDKKEYLFLSKTDMATNDKEIKSRLVKLKKLNKTASVLSILDENSLDNVKKMLNKISKDKNSLDKKI